MSAPVFGRGDQKWTVGKMVRAFWFETVIVDDVKTVEERSVDGLVTRIHDDGSGWIVTVATPDGSGFTQREFEPEACRRLD